MIAKREMRAAATATVLSGLPSTVHALAAGADPLRAARAAGTLLPGHRPGMLAGALAHLLVSSGWSVVLIAIDRRYRIGALGGALAGLLIAALDLELLGRHYPAVRELPRLPQWLDHIAFGAVLGGCLRAGLRPLRDPAGVHVPDVRAVRTL